MGELPRCAMASCVVGKLVHLIGQLGPGGAERQLAYLARKLKERSWVQTVVSFDSGGLWKDHLLEAKVPVLEVPRHPMKAWRLWRLYRLIGQEQPRVLVSWSSHTAVYAHWLAGVGRPRRIFNLRQDLTVDNHHGGPGNHVARCRRAIEAADCVVSNSTHALTALQGCGVRLRKTIVIRNIVFAQGRSGPSEAVDIPRIVAAGSLRPLKAYDVLLRALGILAAEGMRFELLLAGQGPEEAPLRRLAGELRLADRVQFLGLVADVPGLLARAHLAVHPSRSEGLSNTILEAMAEGLPVVATRVGGTSEIIEQGRTGLLVAPGEPVPLAEGIRSLLVNPELRETLGAAAHRYVRDTCNEDVVSDHYERALSGLLLQGQRSR